MPKLSIIVPVYNVDLYLTQCLNSIINQTFTDWEMIVVDDYSTDNSRKIIEEYAKKDPRIKILFHQKNKSLGVARNTGLKIAQGEFVAFVDSDDWLELDMYATMLLEQQISDADIVECNFKYETTDDQNLLKFTIKPGKFNMEPDGENEYLLRIFLGQTSPCVWNKIYRLSTIKKNSLNFVNNNETPFEDWQFNLYLAHHVKLIVAISQPYYHYRRRLGSLTLRKIPDLLEKLIEINNNYIQFITGGDYRKMPPAFSLIIIDQIISSLNHAVIYEKKPIKIGAANLKRALKEKIIRDSLKINLTNKHYNIKKRILLLLWFLKLYRLTSFLFYFYLTRYKNIKTYQV